MGSSRAQAEASPPTRPAQPRQLTPFACSPHDTNIMAGAGLCCDTWCQSLIIVQPSIIVLRGGGVIDFAGVTGHLGTRRHVTAYLDPVLTSNYTSIYSSATTSIGSIGCVGVTGDTVVTRQKDALREIAQ